MAFEKIGLGGFLKFDEKQALAAMGRAQKGFARLKKGAGQVGAGLTQMAGGLRGSAMALAPITAGIGFGIATAAKFEKQMSAVGAITRATGEDLAKLTAEAKRQGVVSVFSAQESAEAMEFLGRAGFNTTQIITGLGGVMNAAAAEGIDLATSADIIAQSVKIFGLEAEQAGHNADVLALASAKSNTNIIALGEALKYGGLSAKEAGLSIEETTAVFGKLADAGLRGSIGGTSFMNMLNKLNKPSSKATAILDKLRIKTRGAGGRLLKMPELVDNLRKGLSKLTHEGERNAAMTELFGLRGQRAYQALASAGGAALQELTDDLFASSFGIGAAAEAAEKRLDNFLGSIKLFASSLEAATIEFFGPFLNSFKEATQDITASLNHVLFAIQKLKAAENAFGLAADTQSKKVSKGIAQQLKLRKQLGDRQGAQAQAAIAALTREQMGNEKLTRAQIKGRNQSFATFVRTGLAQQKLTKKEFRARRKAIDAMIEKIEEGRLSEQETIDLRKQVVKSIVAQQDANGRLSEAERQRRAASITGMIEQQAVQAKIQAEADAMAEREAKLAEIEKKHGTTARLIAEGVLDAIQAIKDGIDTVVQKMKAFGKQLEKSIGKERLRNFTKIATISVIVAGAIAPLIVGFLGLAFVVKSFAGVFIGMGKMVFGVFNMIRGGVQILIAAWPLLKAGAVAAFAAIKGAIASALAAIAPAALPILAVVAVLVGAFLLFRREGESVGDTFRRLWGLIKAGADWVYQNAIKPFVEGFVDGFNRATGGIMAVWERFTSTLSEAWNSTMGVLWTEIQALLTEVKTLFADIFTGILGDTTGATDGMAEGFRTFGDVVGTVVGFVFDVWVGSIGKMIRLSLQIYTFFVRSIVAGLRWIVGFIRPYLEGWVAGFQRATGGIMGIWNRFVATITEAWNSTIGELSAVFSELWAEISFTLGEVKTLFADIFQEIFGISIGTTEGMGENLRSFGDVVGSIVGFIFDVWAGTFGQILRFAIKVFGFLVKVLIKPFRTMLGVVRDVVSAFRKLWAGDFMGFLGKMGSAVTRILTLPFQIMMEGILKLLNALPDDIVGRFIDPGTVKKMEQFAAHGFAEPPPIKQIIETETKGVTKMRSVTGAGAAGQPTDLGGVRKIMDLGVKNAARAAKVQEILQRQGLEVNKANVIAARDALRRTAATKRQDRQRQERIADKELRASVNVEDKRETTVKTDVCIDGEKVAKATAKHKENVFQRTGAMAESFNRGIAKQTGVAVGGGAREA